MKAMILAAGLGTRLRPLTNDRPKALIKVAGRTLLEIALSRLRGFGVREVIINTHHHAAMMQEYLDASNNFGMRVVVSNEEELLDTGGGLKKAAWFFLEGNKGQPEPFILHNVDVISTIDLASMLRAHKEKDALATLAVQDRETSRYLLFDEYGLLCGRIAGRDGIPEMVRSETASKALAFSGIHIISPDLFAKMAEQGSFSIIASYLRLASLGERIIGFRTDEYYWRDLGRPENVKQAEADVRNGLCSVG